MYNRELVTGVVVDGLETERVVEALLDDLLGAPEDSREIERLGIGGGARYLLPGGAAESREYDGSGFLCSACFGSGGTGEGAMRALLGPTLIALGGRDLRPSTRSLPMACNSSQVCVMRSHSDVMRLSPTSDFA